MKCRFPVGRDRGEGVEGLIRLTSRIFFWGFREWIFPLVLMALPALAQAQFTYSINNGAITITGLSDTGYMGPVVIPSTIAGLPVTSIGYSAFSRVSLQTGENSIWVTSVTIPDSVTNIGDWAFFTSPYLTDVTLGAGVISIGYRAFENCASLASISIPKSVSSIGGMAFADCTSLTAITVDALNTNYSSAAGVLFNNSQTSLISYPGGKVGSYMVPDSVTNIEDLAFSPSPYLTSVTLGNNIASIGSMAFGSCSCLTNVTISNGVTSIGDGAFIGCPSLTSVIIPSSVTRIGQQTFQSCSNLTSVTLGNNITSIGYEAFGYCSSLTSVTIPNSVASIGADAFIVCTALTTVTVGNSVTNIGDWAFADCPSLTRANFRGNAPSLGSSVFYNDNTSTIYYLPGTTGWSPTFGGRPTALWVQVPTLLFPPQTQTAEATARVDLGVQASSPLPLFYLWYLNQTNLLSCSTNPELELTNVQLAQSGAYTVVVSNVLGAISSAPVILNVIAAVERRPVPGLRVTAEPATVLNVDYADSLSPAPNWTALASLSLTGTPQYWFDLTMPLPPQRFYRAWQTGAPGVIPSLDLHMVPAITLTGNIGDKLRLDYINRFGPIDAWVTLDTVTLTNTSQLYFDVSAAGQPQRLWRIVLVP